MRCGLLRQVLALLLLATFWPTTVLAQSAQPAGIVTALTGRATVLRASLPPEPIGLKFKDEVFPRDRIRTEPSATVRLLLGGKAVVTIRESSEFAVIEEPRRPSVVDLLRGKLALIVARARMRPGEVIEVQTLNAIAAVRGTILIVEVAPEPTAQLTPGPAAFTTTFHVLARSVEVFPRLKPGAGITLGALQSVNVTGATLGQVRPIPPGSVHQIVQGLRPSPHHAETPEGAKKNVGTLQQARATALAEILAPRETPASTPAEPPPAGAPETSPPRGERGSGPVECLGRRGLGTRRHGHAADVTDGRHRSFHHNPHGG